MANLHLAHTDLVAVVDDSLLSILEKSNWRIGSHGYPVATIDGKAELLHNYVLQLSGSFVDFGVGAHVVTEHINGDKLDSRISNLAQTSQSVNMFRAKGVSVKTQRDSRGYTYYPLCMRWNYSYITIITVKEKETAYKLKPIVKAIILRYIEKFPFISKDTLLTYIRSIRKELYNEFSIQS